MDKETLIEGFPKALISWYDLKPESEVLFISGGDEECEALYEVLENKGVILSRASADTVCRTSGRFDYIIAAGIVERSHEPEELLSGIRRLLKPSGTFLVGAENRLAIRYFCGDKDRFSDHVFDSIDGYVQVMEERMKDMEGRAYSKSELGRMLTKAGFAGYKFYSVMPCLTRPQLIISENYDPNEMIDVRVFPQYNSPHTVFLEEERLYKAIIENHMFHQMANAFLIECPMDGKACDIDQVTVQGDRDIEESMATIIRSGADVRKKALYPMGSNKVRSLMEEHRYLQQHDVPMVEACLKDDSYVMPYVNGQIATEYFREMLQENKDLFIEELESFRRIILSSSEEVDYDQINWRQFEPGWEKRKKDDPNIDKWEKLSEGTEEERRDIGVILKKGYVDLVSINCFHTDKGFQFFDQEFFIENFPANAIFIRTIDFIYRDRPDLEMRYPRDELLKHFHLYEHRDTWRAKGNQFLGKLRNEAELRTYHRIHRRDDRILASNRHRMNYTQDEYNKLFVNIFKDIANKRIYLFGSGIYAERFMEQFGKSCNIAGILDNDRKKWGTYIHGVEIGPPSTLLDVDTPFKVFVCIKYFEGVLKQLKAMGVKEFSVYDWRVDYDRPVKQTIVNEKENAAPKKYQTGYVAGVFDLFHIGHLNLLRRAKEQCNYLIVGIVTDEQVVKSKKTKPYTSFKERLEIVQACRYVDEVVEIPVDRPDTEDAFYMYHFDVQFSGSDYEKEPAWIARKTFLRQHGSDLVFFPYTDGISSTELKEKLGEER